jgi:SAM-dependent methyltransferase
MGRVELTTALHTQPSGRGIVMAQWQQVESLADSNGHIPERIYSGVSDTFSVCSPQGEDAVRLEREAWEQYLSARRRLKKGRGMYEEMFRYEWYEGRNRAGFWGAIERGVRHVALGDAPRIAILSAGSGRDILKVGLAAGVWESTAPKHIRGTWREINPKWFRLVKPDTRFFFTEYSPDNFDRLATTVETLLERGLLKSDMVSLRRWSFRQRVPLVTGSQDLAIFSLTGNYATEEEQPRILNEIARCIRPGGHLIASTMRADFDFIRVASLAYRVRCFLRTPLGWPVCIEFLPWQVWWATTCHRMMEKGYWKNADAHTWADYMTPSRMDPVAIYPAPCELVPVEVLLARKAGMAPMSGNWK